MITVGSAAPDFTLKDQHLAPVSLAEHRGAPVVLVFFPFAFSPLCIEELCRVQDEHDVLERYGARVLAISVDSPFALDAFARHESFDFPLLSDAWPHGEVARRFGVFNEDGGYAERRTFVLDARGVVVATGESEVMVARSFEHLESALAELARA